MKASRCTNYGDCSVADSGKRYDGDFCPECKRAAPPQGKTGLSTGATVAITLGVVFFLLLGLGGAGAWYAYHWWRGHGDELVVEDEFSSQQKAESWTWPWQKEKGDPETESVPKDEAEVRGSKRFEGMPDEMTPPKWWQKWWGLPSEGDMKRALQKEVKPGVRIRGIKLVAMKKLDGESYALEYEVTARVERAVYAVPSRPATIPEDWKLKPEEAELMEEVIFAPNLNPGQSYDWDQKRLVEDTKEATTFSWSVGEARKVQGRWIPLSWAKFTLERHDMESSGL